MNRVTQKHLEVIVARINRMTGNAETPYTRNDNGTYTANLGNYHLSGAYGGVALHQMLNEGGGIRDVFRCGHVTKRDLESRLYAFINGLENSNA